MAGRIVELPLHLKWSGPTRYDLDDPSDERTVYRTVLLEGNVADIRALIDVERLGTLLPLLDLPADTAWLWQDWLAHRDGEVVVEMAHDFRLQPTADFDIGPVLSVEELGADKLLALFGRAEPRDFVDVYFLAQQLGAGDCHCVPTAPVM